MSNFRTALGRLSVSRLVAARRGILSARRALALAAVGLALGGLSLGSSQPSEVRLIVGVEPGGDVQALSRDLARTGSTGARYDADIAAFEVTWRGDPSDGISRLGALAGVRYAEATTRLTMLDQPAEPYYSQQAPYLTAVKAPQAWDITKGSRDIIVAVVDTGVDVGHKDLAQNIWFNPGEIANNGYDDDANGCVDDVSGCAFVSDSSPGCPNVTNGYVRDDIGHGTFVASVIAAAANGQGLVGIARDVRIMPVKVLDCYGSGDSVAVARGLLYAARNGAAVINVSLGGLVESQVLRDAVASVTRDYGVLVVAAAGNSGASGVSFPARHPDAIAVGATGVNLDKRATFSSYGPEVDVVAGGEDIIGAVPPTKCFVIIVCLGTEPYGRGAGTSFSAPQVSGLIALMRSLNRSMGPDRLREILVSTATPLVDGKTPNWDGAGRINMLSALQAVQANVPSGDPCVIASVIDGETFTCTGGRTVRMLQMDAPTGAECGSEWATAAAQHIFLTPGRTVYLQYDATKTDAASHTLAAPIWRGDDGGDYNLSIVMVYVGLARAASIGANNLRYHDWARASETWAAAAQWNMWAPGQAFAGGC